MFKSLILFLFVISTTLTLKAQDTAKYQFVKLVKPADYLEAEPVVMKVSEYLLNSPINKEEQARLDATQFLLKWMEGTPHHTYSFHSRISQITKDNIDLMGVYLAAMVKYSLEYQEEATDLTTLQLNTLKTLITYVANADNGVKLNSELKKINDLALKGHLERYIR